MTEGELAAGPASGTVSSAERQFWLLQGLQPGTRAYHVGSVFALRGDLDVAALRGAFEDLVARHEALGSTFREREGALERCLSSGAGPLFEVEERPGLRPDGEEVAAELRRPFDLAAGPLLRLRLWRTGPGAWLLCWTMHHAVTDLASKELLAAELAERYALRRAGRASPPAPAPHQASGCAAWERGWLASEAAARAEEHFAAVLASPPPPLAIPQDRSRPPLQSSRGACARFTLEAELAAKLRQAAARWRTRPFLVLLAAYALLLARQGGEERVAVGVPFTNRRREESQDAVGSFVHILPVPVECGGAPSFLELLGRVRQTMLGHHRHQELPLERIVARCRPARDPSRNPLFQAGFTFEPPLALALEGLEVTSHEAHAGGAQLDVFLTMWEQGAGFAGRLEYCADLFEPGTVERLLRSFATLLAHLLEPGAEVLPVSRLRMLAPEERALVVDAFNATNVVREAPERLDQLLLAQEGRSPEATALRMGGRRWSYRELFDHARALALHLRAGGVGPGELVGLYMERSFELVTSILATVLAGGAYVPLDPDYPAQRLDAMLEDARPRCILVQDALAGRRTWGSAPERVVRLGELDDLAPPVAFERAALTGDDPAYVIFTSGSTGRPKGVVNSHRGIVNRLLWMQEALRLGPADVVLQKTPFSFDVSVWEFFWPLCVGAQLEVAPPGAHRDPGALVATIRAAGVTTVHFVPSMLQVFLDHPVAARCTTLRRVVASGEALTAELARRCCGVLEGADLHNLYGPTEAAVDVTWWPCREDLGRDPCPSAGPSPTRSSTCSTRRGSRCPSACQGSSTSAGCRWPSVMWAGPS